LWELGIIIIKLDENRNPFRTIRGFATVGYEIDNTVL
jgi:hypothetical protein